MEINKKKDCNIPTLVVNSVSELKLKDIWNDYDNNKIIHDKKDKNIIASFLGLDEFFKVSNYITAKEIWETLEVTYKGMEEV